MVYKLHGAFFSTATQRALVVLEEVGVEYKVVQVAMAQGEHKSPAFLTHRPWGQVPYLEDGDFELYESRAIARYVLDKAGEKGAAFLGTTPEERARVNQWIDVEVAHYEPIVSGLGFEFVIKKMIGKGEANATRVEELREKLDKVLDVYEAHLSNHPYLAGEHITLADLVHLPWTTYALTGIPDLFTSDIFTPRPHVSAWWKRISSRDAWIWVLALSNQP